MSQSARAQAESLLDRLEIRYGSDFHVRQRLLPLIVRILETGEASSERTALLRLVVRSYASHLRARTTIETLRTKLRQRLIETYGQILGIEPPGIGDMI